VRTVSPERWQRIEAVLDGALDRPPAERTAYVAEACGGDAELRADVERLLAAGERTGALPSAPAAQYAAPLLASAGVTADETPPARLGPYRIVGEAGRGGMGAVYVAERDDGHFRMRVALKVVSRTLAADRHFMRRFLDERQLLARLEHPNVARLLDGGVTDDGLPFYVMEYVDGVPLDAFCDARRLPVLARLRLFVRVCDAVQYAHRNLVVHRDLKPSNILVTADGTPKLLDFGIAKLLEEEEPGGGRTSAWLRLMTPEYASPEQVSGAPITTASDVYSLGVLLYELLTGRAPHRRAGRSAREQENAVI
jgi:eukaryotic-like serine/threonine-protein kinase